MKYLSLLDNKLQQEKDQAFRWNWRSSFHVGLRWNDFQSRLRSISWWHGRGGGQSKYTEALVDREKNRKVVVSGEIAGIWRERRERERERREREMPDTEPPLSYKKNGVFYLVTYFLFHPVSGICTMLWISFPKCIVGKKYELEWLGSFKKPNIYFWGTRLSVFISKSRSGPTIHSYESKRNRGLNVCQLLCTFCVSIELEIKLKEIERRRKKTTSFICVSKLFAWTFEKRKKEWKRWLFSSFLWWRCSLLRVQNRYRWR